MAMRSVRAGSQSTPSAASVQQVLDALRLGRVCPISRRPAACPVRAADGQVYERHFIQQWFDDCRRRAGRLTSPVLHTPLTSDTLEPVVISEGDMASPTALPGEVTLAKPFQPPFFEELDKFLETPLVQMLNLRPPAIVPLGVESAGKSTILERIIGLTLLPRDEQMCTRMVIRIHLRRRRQAARMAVRVVRRSREPPFAEDAATERWTPAPDSVPGLLIAMMDNAVREAGRPIVLDKELLVEVYRADVPDLDILDVPGLVTASRAGLEDAPQLTRELIDSVIAAERAHAIFLVIVPATELLNSNSIMSVVQEAGVQQVSLGIRSKADLKVSQDPDVSQTEVVAAELVGTVPDQHGGIFKAPGFVELGLGWLGMANKMSKRMFDTFPEAARGCARLTWMEDQEVRFAQLLQADHAAADAFAFLESRFGAPAVRARVQKEFERFIVERWLTQVRDQLQREHARVTHQYAARGLPVPDERFAAAATAASTPLMADDVARVVRDVSDHVPGSDENIFAERRAYGADAAEFKRILAARVAEVTADRESDDSDWTALQSHDQLWETISRLESTIEAVERRNRDAAAPASQASRLLASSKQQYHAAARVVKDTLVSYAATELVDRFMAALDSAPEHRVQLAAHGALPARTLSSQLRLLDRLPALAESLRVHAAAAVSVTVACEFSARADERIAQETAAAFQCAQSDAAAATSRGKFILRVRHGERSRQLGPDLVDAFLEVVLGGLLSAIRLWDVSEDLLVESASVRSARLSDLKELQVVGDALIALQRLRTSVDGSGGVEAEIPATNSGKVCDLLNSLPQQGTA